MARHRGPGPSDHALFAPCLVDVMRVATGELSWLLSRGYPDRAALALVGDRHALKERQRRAVMRCACSDESRASRRARQLPLDDVRGREVHVDGLNVLIVCESALSGAPVLIGRDGAHRDLASVHGTWRRVSETGLAIERIGALLERAAPREVVFWLDRPVSNSGRLASLLRAAAAEHAWPWRVELAWDPDRELMSCGAIVASGDAKILDADVPWIDLPGAVADEGPAWIIDLGDGRRRE